VLMMRAGMSSTGSGNQASTWSIPSQKTIRCHIGRHVALVASSDSLDPPKTSSCIPISAEKSLFRVHETVGNSENS
jgi:hypothetical protein